MFCLPKVFIGYMGACAFLGAALACFFLPYWADKYGRFYVFLGCSAGQIPLYVLANTTGSIGIIYVLTFYLGVALIGRFTGGFVLLTECLCTKNQTIWGTALMVGDCAATLYITFYLRFISNDIHYLIWVGFGINIFTVFAAYFLVESPSWLVSVGEIERAKKTI